MNKSLMIIALLALALGARAEDDAAKLALAREAISAMQADKMFDNMAVQMKQMASRFSQLPADATPEARQKAEAMQGKVMDLAMNEAKTLISKMDAIYASIYSETELKAMVAFFKSPEGQSMMAKQPQIMGKLMPLMQEMQQNLGPKIKALAEEAKAQAAAAAAPVPAPANP